MLTGPAAVLSRGTLRQACMALSALAHDPRLPSLRLPRSLTSLSSSRAALRLRPTLSSFPSPSRSSLPARLPPTMSTSTTNATATPPSQPPTALTTASVPTVTVRDGIILTPRETELFDTLLAASKAAGVATTLRCAGGWVRDKLLGRDSDDIDIALDDMLGAKFAELVNDYLKAQGREARHAAVIQSNPDQSKHLETARMRLALADGEVWVDLVNLRSESYAADSRIPTMDFGTPEQDALRRDFTINALFYNISAGGVVEDLTGRGLEDLRAGLIRTPLPPMETFLDDPLRVLRAVRFATRFGFRLHEDILAAAASEQVRAALASKISRERVGTELEGMFNGPAPVEAARLLHTLGLFPPVFAPPAPLAACLGPGYGAPCVACMGAGAEVAAGLGLELDKDERRFLLLAALLLPLRGLSYQPPKGRPVPATSAIVRDALKWRVKDVEMTSALHEAAAELAAAHAVLQSGGGGGGAAGDGAGEAEWSGEGDVRVMLGRSIRKLKQHWKLGVVMASVIGMRAAAPLGGEGDAAAQAAAPGGEGAAGAEGAGGEAAAAAAAARLEAARELVAAAEAFGLGECWAWKPLMDGKRALALLGWTKPGPELGRAMAALADWQLAHPPPAAGQASAEQVAAAEAFLLRRFGGGR